MLLDCFSFLPSDELLPRRPVWTPRLPFLLRLKHQRSHCNPDAMAEGGRYSGAVDVTAADPDASATDFLPLDDSDSSNAQQSPLRALDGNGSPSDVSMEAQSEDEDDAIIPTPHTQTLLADAAVSTTSQPVPGSQPAGTASKKRKSPVDTSQPETRPNTLDSVKKLKLEQSEEDSQGDQGSGSVVDRSTLPAEIWHHIFTFCPPRILGRLLCVNRLFNVYLDSSSKIRCDRPKSPSSSVLSPLQPTAIWQASRRRFWPSMPSPLHDKTELDMWQLSVSTTCQHCRRQGTVHKDSPDPWQSGPGKDGVAIIWAFATRSCGACLLTKSIKVCALYIESNYIQYLLSNAATGDRYSAVVVLSQHSGCSPTVRLRYAGASRHLPIHGGTESTTTEHFANEDLLVSTCRGPEAGVFQREVYGRCYRRGMA